MIIFSTFEVIRLYFRTFYSVISMVAVLVKYVLTQVTSETN